MGSRIKLPNIDYAKIGNTFGQAAKTAVKFAADHKREILMSTAAAIALLDNVRVRICRKNERKHFEETELKQMTVIRKLGVVANGLISEAEQCRKTGQTVELLEHLGVDKTEEVPQSE